MTNISEWVSVISRSSCSHFSPSGRALAIQPTERQHTLRSLEVHFSDDRKPFVFEEDGMIVLLAWSSETELVYCKFGNSPGRGHQPTLHVVSVEDGKARPLPDLGTALSATTMGRDGRLCVLSCTEGNPGLFELDTHTGTANRLTAFDSAFVQLDVYPSFRHAWSAERQEVTLTAWPRDYLEPGVESTTKNSQWIPGLDESANQDEVVLLHDGSKMTKRELNEESKRRKPFRLFRLDAAGACAEIPDTYHARCPLWSPDGSVLAFKRYEFPDEGLWLLYRSDLSVHRVGTCYVGSNPLWHPSGVLFCHLSDETNPLIRVGSLSHLESSEWRHLTVRNGEIHLSKQRRPPTPIPTLTRPERGYIH